MKVTHTGFRSYHIGTICKTAGDGNVLNHRSVLVCCQWTTLMEKYMEMLRNFTSVDNSACTEINPHEDHPEIKLGTPTQ